MGNTSAPGEIAALGRRLFQEKVRPLIAPTDRMKYLVIEVESDYIAPKTERPQAR